VDGRKGIDSLARLCQERLQTDPFSGCLFVFRSRRGTAIRILVYDGQGFGWRRSGFRKGVFAGGRKGGIRARWRGVWRRINCKCCWRRATRRPPGRASMAAAERVGLRKKAPGTCVLNSSLLRSGHGRRVSLPRASDHRGGSRIYPSVDRPISPDQSAAASLRLCEAWDGDRPTAPCATCCAEGCCLELARAGHLELPSATHVQPQPHGPLFPARPNCPDKEMLRRHIPSNAWSIVPTPNGASSARLANAKPTAPCSDCSSASISELAGRSSTGGLVSASHEAPWASRTFAG